ncbi:hypothetical protein D3C81_1409360 [compost metagenome]
MHHKLLIAKLSARQRVLKVSSYVNQGAVDNTVTYGLNSNRWSQVLVTSSTAKLWVVRYQENISDLHNKVSKSK